MRKFLIDTDTASDDSAAIMIAALSEDIDLVGLTAVTGNVPVEQAAKNALMTLEKCHCDAPVYLGASRPLFRERKETVSVHGIDGMGDYDMIHPVKKPARGRAVDFILKMAKKYPDELEILAIGPVTNIALAIMTDRKVMSRVKRIWSMGTPGFGPGNATPLSEFNVFIDAEAYRVMLESGIPVTVIGFDLSTNEAAITVDDARLLRKEGNEAGRFLSYVTRKLADFDLMKRGVLLADLPDAIAMGVAEWPEIVKRSVSCHTKCCTEENATYGQVILYPVGAFYESTPDFPGVPCDVTAEIDEPLFKEKLMSLLMKPIA